MRHIIWDWNGTLLHDLPIVVRAVDHAVRRLGGGPVSVDDYRDHFTRPVSLLYEGLIGRKIEAEEWEMVDGEFHRVYNENVDGAELADGAVESLESVLTAGRSQSLLSMYAHSDLLEVVDRRGIKGYFSVVQGLVGPPGGLKAVHLGRHLEDLAGLGVEQADVVMIGDTPDDAHAAKEQGLHCVLYDGGSHHLHDLEAVGVPVAGTISEAVEIASR